MDGAAHREKRTRAGPLIIGETRAGTKESVAVCRKE